MTLCGCASSRSFTLMEAVIAIALVGGVMAAAMHTIGGAVSGQAFTAEQAAAELLAQDLLTEILMQQYEDAEEGVGSFGLPAGEDTGTRMAFDDVDDYHGWAASPPQAKDGTKLGRFEGWQRTVLVMWCDPVSPEDPQGSDSRVKTIRVMVSRNGTLLSTASGVRSASGDRAR